MDTVGSAVMWCACVCACTYMTGAPPTVRSCSAGGTEGRGCTHAPPAPLPLDPVSAAPHPNLGPLGRHAAMHINITGTPNAHSPPHPCTKKHLMASAAEGTPPTFGSWGAM